jgi:pimeloyl-ACP methyl ester carboxylesterase
MPESKYIQSQGINLHYLEWGNPNSPDLLLVHGWTNIAESWTQVAEYFENEFHIIAPDNRGHGLSDKPSTGYLLNDFVEDTATIISALELKHPIYIGHSWGANIGTILAADHPELISKAFLEDPVYWKFINSFATSLPVGLARLNRPESEIREQGIQNKLTPDEIKFEIYRHHHFSPAALTHLLKDNRSWAFSCEDFIQRIKVPTLVLVADNKLGGAILPEEMDYFQTIGSDFINFRRWEGVGHGMHTSNPERFNQELSSFISAPEV